jgi:ABC-2 type transport system ATP-binding protein
LFRVPIKAPGLVGALKHLARPRCEDRLAADRIDLRIDAGESVAYVGPNGAVILGKSEVPPWLGYVSPTAALAVAFVASLIWRAGLRRYQGTGH